MAKQPKPTKSEPEAEKPNPVRPVGKIKKIRHRKLTFITKA